MMAATLAQERLDKIFVKVGKTLEGVISRMNS